ncbi:MAG: hypothetical protein ACRD9W_14560 [Terriglobia bacterium]
MRDWLTGRRLRRATVERLKTVLSVAATIRNQPDANGQEFLATAWSDAYGLGWLVGDATAYLTLAITGRSQHFTPEQGTRAQKVLEFVLPIASGQQDIMQRVAQLSRDKKFTLGARRATAHFWCAKIESSGAADGWLPDWLEADEDVQFAKRQLYSMSTDQLARFGEYPLSTFMLMRLFACYILTPSDKATA